MRSRRNTAESKSMPMVVAVAAIETSNSSDLLPAAVEPPKAEAADQFWLTRQKRNHAGFANTLPFGSAKPPAVATRSLRIARPLQLSKDMRRTGAVASDGIEEHLSAEMLLARQTMAGYTSLKAMLATRSIDVGAHAWHPFHACQPRWPAALDEQAHLQTPDHPRPAALCQWPRRGDFAHPTLFA